MTNLRKIILLGMAFILLCFLIPVLFVTRREPRKTSSPIITEYEKGYGDSVDINTIRLLLHASGEIIELPLEEYLYGVVASEMPASFEMEALKAQAVVARTFTIKSITESPKHIEEGADICDNFACCQAWITKSARFERWPDGNEEEYWERIVTSVRETRGKIVKFEGRIASTFYHANSGGKTEAVQYVWGSNDHPYLQAVETSRRIRIYAV